MSRFIENMLHGNADASMSPYYSRERIDLTLGCVVFVVAVLVYLNTLWNGFVWDDVVIVVNNTALRGDPRSLFKGLDVARDYELTPYYRPITLLSFMMDIRLHNLNPAFCHFVNVLLHAVNSFLVYRLARNFFATPLPALLAGLLFAVHPIGCESVAFISARNNLIACFFVLAAALCYLQSMKTGKNLLSMYGMMFLLGGLLSKEQAVMLLPLIMILEAHKLVSDNGSFKVADVWRVIPYIVCTIFYFVLRHNVLTSFGVTTDSWNGMGGRLLNNIYIIPHYLYTLIWPPALSVMYVIPDDLHLLVLLLLLAWLVIISALVWLMTKGRSRVTIFGVLWLVLFWLPTSGIIKIPSDQLADRFMYMPVIGLWLVIADQTERFVWSRVHSRKFLIPAMAVVVMLLAAFSLLHNFGWKDDVTLFTTYVKRYPHSAAGHLNLGCAYLNIHNNIPLAEQEFNKVLEIEPLFPRLSTQLGYISMLRGDYKGALIHYDQALAVNFLDLESLLNKGDALDKLGRYEEALESYRRFLALQKRELHLARPGTENRVRELEAILAHKKAM